MDDYVRSNPAARYDQIVPLVTVVLVERGMAYVLDVGASRAVLNPVASEALHPQLEWQPE